MKNYRVCYSLNLAAYVHYVTGIAPDIFQDTNGYYYCVYELTPEVIKAIDDWKDSGLTANLHDYLAIFAQLKKRISNKRRNDAKKAKENSQEVQ